MDVVGITGCEGYIGSALLPYLEANGRRCIGLSHQQGDITEPDYIERALDGHTPSALIHLAGLTGVENSWKYPQEYYRVNVLGTQRVLDYCANNSVRLILVSSYLYRSAGLMPVAEGAQIEARNPYAHTKLLAEEVCVFYKEHMRVNAIIVRPFNVYGNQQKSDFLIPFLIEQAKTEGTNSVFVRDHLPVRDFLYIDDLLSALSCLIDYRGSQYIFNIGTGIGSSVKEAANLIIELWAPGKKLVSQEQQRRNEILSSVACIDLIRSETGWMPQYSLRQGLMAMFHSGR